MEIFWVKVFEAKPQKAWVYSASLYKLPKALAANNDINGAPTKNAINIPIYGIAVMNPKTIPNTRAKINKRMYHPMYLPTPISLMSPIT